MMRMYNPLSKPAHDEIRFIMTLLLWIAHCIKWRITHRRSSMSARVYPYYYCREKPDEFYEACGSFFCALIDMDLLPLRLNHLHMAKSFFSTHEG